MTPLYLYSEPYRPEGNIDARAARRALGHPPQLGAWALFLRETLQNSWDARSGDRIAFRVDAWWPDQNQAAVLANEIFGDLPPAKALGDYKPSEELPVLVVTDHGTRGLGGPTRADLARTERTDFVDFIRNIGRAEDKELGGGTYGFGKGVLYEASVCSTIVVFTRTTERDRPVSRLMAVRLGSSYEIGRKRFTGRHWWGVANDDTGAEPLTGRAAERLATRLGMSFIPDGETGTSIMIVGPAASREEETVDDVVGQIADAALWWAWPHMVPDPSTGLATIDFSFSQDGERLIPPYPGDHDVLKHYVDAYRRAGELAADRDPPEGWPWTDKRLRSGHGGRNRLGVLSYRKLLPHEIIEPAEFEPPASHHVALMRAQRMIVKYLEAPRDARGLGTAGVFIAEPALDGEFALSEPVAHDDWVPQNIGREKFQRNNVKQAMEALRRELRPSTTDAGPVGGGESLGGLVAIANALGGLLEGHGIGSDARIAGAFGGSGSATSAGSAGAGPDIGGGPGAGAAAAGGGRGSGDVPAGEGPSGRGVSSGRGRGRVRLTARLDGFPRLAVGSDGRPVPRFPVRVVVPAGQTAIVSAQARAVLDGGSEAPTEAPLGADIPEILGWSPSLDAGQVPSPGPARLQQGEHTIWVWVRQPADTAVTVVLAIEKD